MGRALTLSNLFSFGGVGLLQLLSGWVIGFFTVTNGARPPSAYSALFWCVAGLAAVAVLIYVWIQDPDFEMTDPA